MLKLRIYALIFLLTAIASPLFGQCVPDTIPVQHITKCPCTGQEWPAWGAMASPGTATLFTNLTACGTDGEGECDVYSAELVHSCNGYSLTTPKDNAKLNVDALPVAKPEFASHGSLDSCSVTRSAFDHWLNSARKSQGLSSE